MSKGRKMPIGERTQRGSWGNRGRRRGRAAAAVDGAGAEPGFWPGVVSGTGACAEPAGAWGPDGACWEYDGLTARVIADRSIAVGTNARIERKRILKILLTGCLLERPIGTGGEHCEVRTPLSNCIRSKRAASLRQIAAARLAAALIRRVTSQCRARTLVINWLRCPNLLRRLDCLRIPCLTFGISNGFSPATTCRSSMTTTRNEFHWSLYDIALGFPLAALR